MHICIYIFLTVTLKRSRRTVTVVSMDTYMQLSFLVHVFILYWWTKNKWLDSFLLQTSVTKQCLIFMFNWRLQLHAGG